MVGSVIASLVVGAVLQLPEQLPEVVRQTATSLPEPVSTTGAIFYGAWGLLGFSGAKSVLGRFRSTKSKPAPTVKQDSGTVRSSRTTVGKTQGSGGSKSSVAFTLPSFLPLSKGIRSVTHHEVHAVELGLVVGVTNAWLLSIGRRNVSVTIAVAFVAGALGYKRYKTKAFKTIRMEPWYGLLAFGGGTIAGMLLFDPATLKSVVGL